MQSGAGMSIRAAPGSELSCRSWLTEAALRMLMNNLDAEVAERPGDLVVYGGVGMGYSQHAGVVVVCDGTAAADRRLERVLWNDPASGVMRHADVGYPQARACAREYGLELPCVVG